MDFPNQPKAKPNNASNRSASSKPEAAEHSDPVGLQSFPSPSVDPSRASTPLDKRSDIPKGRQSFGDFDSSSNEDKSANRENGDELDTDICITRLIKHTKNLQTKDRDNSTTNQVALPITSLEATQSTSLDTKVLNQGPQSPTPESQPTDSLPTFDWTDLENRFQAEIAHLHQKEDDQEAAFERWSKLFKIWHKASQTREETCGAKRLRTQIAYVQIAEEGFEAQRLHYEKCQRQAGELLESLRRDV